MTAVLPGPVRQIGHVVSDLDAAIAAWVALGVGPWLTIRDQPVPMVVRGAPSTPTVSLAFANSGPMQLELIEQHDAAPSAYREFTDRGGEGFHHLAWWADDLDPVLQAGRDAGWTTIQETDGSGLVRFVYLDPGGPRGTVVELMELNDVTRWMVETVARAAADWDGVTDPVRPLA